MYKLLSIISFIFLLGTIGAVDTGTAEPFWLSCVKVAAAGGVFLWTVRKTGVME